MKHAPALFALLLASAAAGQEANPFEGQWTAKWSNEAGQPREARFELAGAAGSWQQIGRKDYCDSRRVPVQVEKAAGSELAFVIRYSEGAPTCRDRRISATKVDERTLQGNYGNNAGGGAVQLTRP